ncbi:hypothetical protein DAEQUDRAFT_753891 [Daedalea quercina L-15889]|uniref:Uncharacterized protein n=1 Tax=Daedalea quercina L-15889 TaxID=1314783 RepID=A0A165U668_9APHY|nr:hypothetical protein DAEQUDRAFT_753891 [Daedalea quercina L-15889]
MPSRNELLLSLIISAFLHVGLTDYVGHGLDDFLGLFTAYASFPVLYMAYGLSLWFCVFSACRAVYRRIKLLGRRLFRRNEPCFNPGSTITTPPELPASHADTATEGQCSLTPPVRSASPLNTRAKAKFCSSKGEQARRLRACREGRINHEPRGFTLLWDSPVPPNGIGTPFILPVKPVAPAPAPTFAKPDPQSDAVKPAQAATRVRPHPYRVCPASRFPEPVNLALPTTAFEREFWNWRRWNDQMTESRAKRGLPPLPEGPFEPIPRVQPATKKKISAHPLPAPEPALQTAALEPVVQIPAPTPVVQPLQPVAHVSAAPKIKARVEKVKMLKARAHAILDRQARTMSLIDSNVRRGGKDESPIKRKPRSPRRAFGAKAVQPPHGSEPMDVDTYDSDDSMDIDPLDQVDDLCVRLQIATIF